MSIPLLLIRNITEILWIVEVYENYIKLFNLDYVKDRITQENGIFKMMIIFYD